MTTARATASLESSVLGVLDASGQRVGVGFLIAPDLAVTCAHVISDVAAEEPGVGSRVLLDLPLATRQGPGCGGTIEATVECWQPVAQDGRGDIAVLRLPAAPPGGSPAALVESADVQGHPMVAFGFPHRRDDGVWHEGRLLRRQATGWIQVQLADPTGQRIEQGFSGAPAWDGELGGVVGMVVASDSSNSAGYVIPTETLLDAKVDLRARVPYWRSLRDDPEIAPVPAHPPRPSWWDRVEPDAPLALVPPTAARPGAILLIAVLWGLLVLAWLIGSVVTGPHDPGSLVLNVVLILAVGALALPSPWRARLPRGFQAAVVILNVLIAGALVAASVSNTPDAPPLWFVAVFLLVQGGGVLVGVLASRWMRRRDLDLSLPGPDVLAQRVFGSPGQAVAIDPNPETQRDARHKRGAQRACSALLESMLRIPAARLLHAPPAPAQGERRIDHAVVAGRRVALIYSVLWPPGHYANAGTSEQPSIRRNGSGFPVAFPDDYPHFLGQVAQWRSALPEAEVRGFVVVHPSPPGPVTVDLPGYPATVLLAEHAVEVVGEWLAGDEPTTVDRKILGTLLDPAAGTA